MENDFNSKIVESTKASLESFKTSIEEIAAANVAAIGKLQKNVVNPGASAELSKMFIDFTKGMGELFTNSTNQIFQEQLKLINLQTLSGSFKALAEIYTNTMNSLGQKQGELLNIYTENIAKYLDSLNDAKKIDDVAAIQNSIFTDLQEKAKKNMTDTMGVLNSFNSAMDIWTQKSLDSMSTKKAE